MKWWTAARSVMREARLARELSLVARRWPAEETKNPGRMTLRGLSVRITCHPDISEILDCFCSSVKALWPVKQRCVQSHSGKHYEAWPQCGT